MAEPQLDASLDEAQALIAGGEFERAKSILLDATQTHPSSANAWKELGVAENKLGEHEAAERHLLESLRLDDCDADAWSSLGGVYVSLARYEEALRSFERGLTTGEPDTYSLLNFLTMAAIAGDYEASFRRWASALREGRGDCERQISRGVNLPWCYYDLAQILFFSNEEYRPSLHEALGRSSGWQAASARRTYDLLATCGRFVDSANEALAEFAAHERRR